MASENTNPPSNVEPTTQNPAPVSIGEPLAQPPEQSITAFPGGIRPGANPDFISPQRSSRAAEDYVLGIAQQLNQRRVDIDRFQIDVNGKTVFKMNDGEIDTRRTTISDDHSELIKKALTDPASLDGSVKISQGSQLLLHVKDGRVLVDALGLTKESAKVEVQTPNAPSKDLYERSSKEVTTTGLQATQDIAAKMLNTGVGRDQVVDLLKDLDPGYQKLARDQGEERANQAIEHLVNAAEVSLAQQKSPDLEPSQAIKASRARA